jgi:glycosyltransferase involved in cell wall biosynthesis
MATAKYGVMKPLVPSLAVIMPVLNAGPFVAGAIESVLAQVPPGADLLVVDGGSTDSSAAIAAGFPGVRLLAQSGRGLAAARNQGLAAVDADLVGFCDADDRWTEGALAARLACLQSRPDCDAVIGQIVGEALAGEPLTPQQASRLGQPLPGFTPGALLARRRVFQRVGGFDETLAIGADSDWFVRLQQTELRLAVLPAVVLHKGARATSLSTDIETYRRELLRAARGFLKHRRGSPR